MSRVPLDTAAIAEADARVVGSQAWSAERVYEREWAETLAPDGAGSAGRGMRVSGKR
jgi:hypothetical protein